jgi:hypothetical protein
MIDRGTDDADVVVARWELQRHRDEAADVPPAVRELVMAMYEAEAAALARLSAAM